MATSNTNKIPPSPSSTSAVSGSDPTLNHTTFVQADPSTFRALVQKLTGATEDPSMEKLPVTVPARQSGNKPEMGPRRPAFKLQERRQNMRKLEIQLGSGIPFNGGNGVFSGSPCGSSGGKYNRVLISPVSPFDFISRGSPRTPKEEEERAIAEKGFYLHPSPLSTPRSAEPELLPLFPLHSPREPSSS